MSVSNIRWGRILASYAHRGAATKVTQKVFRLTNLLGSVIQPLTIWYSVSPRF